MKLFLSFVAIGMLAFIAATRPAFPSGQTKPLTDPEVIAPADRWLRCENDPGRTFRFEHQRESACKNHERREPECTMWRSGVMVAVNEKECA